MVATLESHLRRADNVLGLAEQLRSWIRDRPHRLALQFKLGEVLVELGEAEEGFAEIREVLRRSPGRMDLHERVARLLESSGRIEAAVEQWQQMVELSPDNGDLLLELARAQHAQEDTQTAAASSVQRWLDLQPEPTVIQLIRAADLFERYDDPELAEKILRQAMAIDMQDLEPRLRLASLLHRIPDRRSEAVPLLKAAPPPDKANTAIRIATAIGSLGKNTEALEYLRQHEETLGKAPAYLDKAGLLAEQIGDIPLAFDLSLRRLLALAQDPNEAFDLRSAIVHAANLARVKRCATLAARQRQSTVDERSRTLPGV